MSVYMCVSLHTNIIGLTFDSPQGSPGPSGTIGPSGTHGVEVRRGYLVPKSYPFCHLHS